MGGHGVDEEYLSTAHVYDPQADSWQPLASMATERAGFATAAAGGKIYVIGGESIDYDGDGAMATTTEAFDPLLSAWAEVASMSVKGCNHATAVVDGKIYAIGGYDLEGQQVDSVEAYDPEANSWQQVAPMPREPDASTRPLPWVASLRERQRL